MGQRHLIYVPCRTKLYRYVIWILPKGWLGAVNPGIAVDSCGTLHVQYVVSAGKLHCFTDISDEALLQKEAVRFV